MPPDSKHTIEANITNTGKMEGDEVVQLYIQDVIASVTRPSKELKAFQRIHLKAGEKKTVTFPITTDHLALYNRKMERTTEPGIFRVMVGRSSDDILLEGDFEIKE